MSSAPPTSVITESSDLAEFCQKLSTSDYITVDTEFMRDRTYWPRLCLIQAANDEHAAAIDPLAEDLDMAPFYALLQNEAICKVFHAARQDVEIFYHLTQQVPHPIFDTQIAAMVCGFGESVGYDRLVEKIAKARIDKASRFTDWARRPLNERQIEYALSDVTHLRKVYKWLAKEIEREGRASWLDEEMATLTSPDTYRLDPDLAWQRIKVRSRNRRYIGVMKEVAAWREREAQRRDVPRNHVLKDEAIQELAAEQPQDAKRLGRLRAVPRGFAEGRQGQELMAAIAKGMTLPEGSIVLPPSSEPLPKGLAPMIDLLKVLLKLKSEEHNVASKLIATVADLEAIAMSDTAEVAALHGWRREIFGADALALKNGELALSARKGRVRLTKV